MSDKLTKKDIENLIKKINKDFRKQIKDHFGIVNSYLSLLKVLHKLSLAHKNLERTQFESKVKEFVGEADFHNIKDFMKYEKAS